MIISSISSARSRSNPRRSRSTQIGDSHCALGQSYKEATESIELVQGTNDSSFGILWKTVSDIFRREAAVQETSGLFLRNFSESFTSWRYEQSKRKREIIAETKEIVATYQKAKYRVDTAKKRFGVKCNQCKRALQRRNRDRANNVDTDEARVKSLLNEVQDAQTEFEAASAHLMRSYLRYREDMKKQMGKYQRVWYDHNVKIKEAMRELLKIEEGVVHQARILLRDETDALRTLNAQSDAHMFVSRNSDLICDSPTVLCMRNESMVIQNARQRLGIPKKRHKRTKPKNLTWTERFTRLMTSKSGDKDEATNDTSLKKSSEYVSLTPRAQAQLVMGRHSFDGSKRGLSPQSTESSLGAPTSQTAPDVLNTQPPSKASPAPPMESPTRRGENESEETSKVDIVAVGEEENVQENKEDGRLIAVALYPFEGRDESELSFNVGARIHVTSAEGEWWHGTWKGAAGEFPRNYVEVPKKKKFGAQESRLFMAMHSFDKRDSTELTVRQGDLVKVKSSGLEEWVMATSEDGTIGLVPSTYLKQIKSDEGVEEDAA